MPVRFIMIGGFLGAGKTTTIRRLADTFRDAGDRIGIVTNDQAEELVDTQNLRSQGFAVEEVPGSCFCCAFDKLSDAMSKLKASERPTVLIAEPVGSCTDLVATVLEPVRRFFPDEYIVHPLVVLLDPGRARKILTRAAKGGFSPKAAYIYEKQLQEADVIVVNKSDLLNEAAGVELVDLVKRHYPNTPVVRVSAKTGEGWHDLISAVDSLEHCRHRTPEIDYETYAEGEAELGWLNHTVSLSSPNPFMIDDIAIELLRLIHADLDGTAHEAAHIKVIIEGDGRQAVANIVRNDLPAELSLSSEHSARQARMTLNARVFMDPERLSELGNRSIDSVCSQFNVDFQVIESRHLRPGRPVPTHRYRQP